MTAVKPEIGLSGSAGKMALSLTGDWSISNAPRMDKCLKSTPSPAGKNVTIDASAITAFDTFGAWLIFRLLKQMEAGAKSVSVIKLNPQLKRLVKSMSAHDVSPPAKPIEVGFVEKRLKALGWLTAAMCSHYGQLFAFIGFVLVRSIKALRHPKQFRLTSLVFHLEEVGFNALFIVGLVSFLIGAVIVNQGAIQLRQFGAEIFTVDLLAISHLREMGILLTAILIAGRSGSAFTAEIGSMKIREEVDALQVIGLNPVDVLVLPRLMALIFIMPILTFFADLMGILGGALMAWNMLDLSFEAFFTRFRDATLMTTFYIGMIKAPFFGAIIAINGCYEGLSVTGSAENVGQHTTRSVVQSIFMVIVLDALFAMFFTAVDW
ncbi:MAG: MlaE family lipid ABC transporter permease subunit [Proteobacteria bacterium]|nr:MlaE family lipid ABC transporter permease subunit [Pseudomonadota bacterium]